jgi:hypothetical protein
MNAIAAGASVGHGPTVSVAVNNQQRASRVVGHESV